MRARRNADIFVPAELSYFGSVGRFTLHFDNLLRVRFRPIVTRVSYSAAGNRIYSSVMIFMRLWGMVLAEIGEMCWFCNAAVRIFVAGTLELRRGKQILLNEIGRAHV